MKSLQFILDREALEIIYASFIRPIMEYGCTLWDGCTETDALKLERVQLTAARIITGAMLTTSNEKLYEETGLVTLAKRRETFKLTQMYKINNNLAPNYLSNISPFGENFERQRNTRQTGLPLFRTRTALFENSFFPSTTRLWNELPLDVRNLKSLTEFKKSIASSVPRSLKQVDLYYIGKRFLSVLHSRLRMGRSQLKAHLFKIGVSISPDCSCGQGIEDAWHYFFVCPQYAIQRDLLHRNVSLYASFTLQTVLYGAPECSLDNNKSIFLSVHEYILKTQRFKPNAVT